MTKKYLLLIVTAALLMAACGKDDNKPAPEPGDGNGNLPVGFHFGIKAATVVYSTDNYASGDENNEMRIVFDDYGKKFRWEAGDAIYIVDETAQTAYVLMPEAKMYMDYPGVASVRFAFTFYGDDVASPWKYYPGFTKQSNKTIAGKNCTVYSWTDGSDKLEWGGWKRITFWMKSTNDEDGSISKFEAKSITESAASNSFTVPSDYTKM